MAEQPIQPQKNNRKRYIGIFIGALIFVSTFVYLYNDTMTPIREDEELRKTVCDDTWCIKLYGDIDETIYVGLQYCLNDTYQTETDKEFFVKNSFDNDLTEKVTGVQLWDVIQKNKVDISNATVIVFYANDGYKSFALPIDIVKNHPSEVLIVTHEWGQKLKTKEDGGTGPLKIYVGYDVVVNDPAVIKIFEDTSPKYDPSVGVYNSAYVVKYCNAIEFI